MSVCHGRNEFWFCRDVRHFYWRDFWFGLRAIFFVNFVKFIYYENKIICCIYNYNNIYLLLRILWVWTPVFCGLWVGVKWGLVCPILCPKNAKNGGFLLVCGVFFWCFMRFWFGLLNIYDNALFILFFYGDIVCFWACLL